MIFEILNHHGIMCHLECIVFDFIDETSLFIFVTNILSCTDTKFLQNHYFTDRMNIVWDFQ